MCTVSEFRCQDNNCTQVYTGDEDHIFFLTETLGIGEEVIWDFLGWLDFGRLSFTKFCEQTTHIYHSVNPSTANFVSNKTFIDTFFCWIVCLGFDFRDEIDPFCGHDPPVLACDGTHIGVSIKHLLSNTPISAPELEETVQPVHQPMDRCFLPYGVKGEMSGQAMTEKMKEVRRAREFLMEECVKCLTGEDGLNAMLAGLSEEEQERERVRVAETYDRDRKLVTDSLEWAGLNGYSAFLDMFLDRTADISVVRASGKLLKLLLTQNKAVSTLIPFRFLEHLKGCCETLETGCSPPPREFTNMEGYSKEIAELLLLSQVHNTLGPVIQFLNTLVSFVTGLHDKDRPVPDAAPIPFTYNPPSGVAYYFTSHGCKVRECPEYDVGDRGKGDPEDCNKYFPQVSYGGFGYMFLFFCPLHGHSYGFHLIHRGEGRKDPFSALFKYKPTPPKDLFYDFACQLSDYCLTREPEFFKWVRFWHDIFHGVNHKCVPGFKSTRVNGLGDVNSEVCEQFNSYMQSIKFTGSSLSQIHFVLFAQFMIVKWNRGKTVAFNKVALTSSRGLV
jgi:hypothetical protein